MKVITKKKKGSKTIKELALAHAPIVVRIDTYFSDALRLLYDNRISGIALIDHEGRLSANLSASDLRGLTPESFDLFTGSVLQFMAKAAIHKPHAPITCKETETLTEVVKKLHENHIHRVYIVDDNDRPTGVVSISDVLLALRTN